MRYREVELHWPFPGPPCLSCPPEWREPIRERYERVLVSMTPYTREGVPLGPGRAKEIHVSITGGRAVGGLVDVGQGQYLQLIEYPKGKPPRVSATVGGVSSEKKVADPRIGAMRKAVPWVVGLVGVGAGIGIGAAVTR